MAVVLKLLEPLTTPTASADGYTRLHITPLDESLLSIVVPSSILPRARNISYHTLETFPEKRFGFVELPTADADKIKKKLNGTVLRGTKMRIEKARPESIPEPTAGADQGAADASKAKKEKKTKSKKRKRDIDVTPGVELEGRKIKRGWTTSEREMIEEKRKKAKKDKKSKETKEERKKEKKMKKREIKSKYTDGPECLFKTKLPGPGPSPAKDDEEATEHKKKRRKSGREVVVHEFEKTVKHPSFLKANATTGSSEAVTFEDGVGWVDRDGKVVEPVVRKRRDAQASRQQNMTAASDATAPEKEGDGEADEDDDDTSSSGSSSDDSEDDDGSDRPEPTTQHNKAAAETAEVMAPPKLKLKVETSALSSPTSALKPESARPKSSSSVTSLTIKIPPATPASAKVHPLEALYKRPPGGAATPGQAAAEPFSFFGGDDDDDDDMEDEDDVVAPLHQPPMTPFTKQDFDFRNVRSAAPTPDTAHPSRTFNLWPRNGLADDDDDDDEADADGEEPHDGKEEQRGDAAGTANGPTGAGADASQAPLSDFQKQFWERRGDLNRAWRRRRKAAAKEKRYRENRARAGRAT
ncbi:hypothetical protein GGS23DRAFT_438309 [Durotheca rogersii]|uniref:uncharacterized protein n=1 Tax=Durotheca rogersii TaxID=419775 RepID=UPI002220BEC1|nr:uncharacterized protein GGS23DRAFT_438309 [Durotheca rogersii]KAI5856150.1 hypothetical protein GGS23DRAFT_438309 [Durotheca rogersii]